MTMDFLFFSSAQTLQGRIIPSKGHLYMPLAHSLPRQTCHSLNSRQHATRLGQLCSRIQPLAAEKAGRSTDIWRRGAVGEAAAAALHSEEAAVNRTLLQLLFKQISTVTPLVFIILT